MRSVFKILFGIPPIEERPQKQFFLNHLYVAGYSPESVESFILYKGIMFCLWLCLAAISVYFLSVIFPIDIEIIGAGGDKPVNAFKDHYTKTLALPIIALSYIYTILLCYMHKDKHDWHFSSLRPVYIENLKRIKQKRFGFLQLVWIHLLGLMIVFCIYWLDDIIDLLNRYIEVKNFNDFNAESLKNFLLIAIIYIVYNILMLSVFVTTSIVFFEKIYSQQTNLKPIFRKRK